MTPKQAARELQNIGKRIERAAKTGLSNAAREGRMIARQDSSGRWNRKRRQKAGYTYSSVRPNPPPQPLGVINVESGQFRSAWISTPAKSFGSGEIAAFVENRSDRAANLTATGKPWLYRPIAELVRARLLPVTQFEVEKAISRVRM